MSKMAIFRGGTKGLMVELEKVYDDFCVIDEEYETLVSNEEHAEHQIV